MEVFKTVPAYSWLFIYFRMIRWSSLKPHIYGYLLIFANTEIYIEKLSRRHFINSFDVFNIQGLTVGKHLSGKNLILKNVLFIRSTDCAITWAGRGLLGITTGELGVRLWNLGQRHFVFLNFVGAICMLYFYFTKLLVDILSPFFIIS